MGFASRSIFFGAVLIALIALFIGVIEEAAYVSLSKTSDLGSIRRKSPANSVDYGRFTKPLKRIDYSWVSASALFNYFNKKHWHFKSIVNKEYFIVVAVADFNYVANAFVYFVNRTTPDRIVYQYSGRSIFSNSILSQAKSSVHDCTKYFQSSTEFITFCYNDQNQKYLLQAEVPLSDGHQMKIDFEISFSAEINQSMVLLYPVKTYRPAYTHKAAVLNAKGAIQIDSMDKQTIDDGLSSIDWTMGYPERQCHWKWVSLSTWGTNTSNNESIRIGINLSDIVYNADNNISMEGAVWIDQEVYVVGSIVYDLPDKEFLNSKPWKIYSKQNVKPNNVELQLTFQPWGSHEEHTNVFLLKGDFVQVFGVFNGNIDIAGHVYTINDGFGVTEKHYAKW